MTQEESITFLRVAKNDILEFIKLVEKRDKMLGKPRILSLSLNSFNKFNKTWVLM